MARIWPTAVADQLIYSSIRTDSRHPAAFDSDAHWRAPSEIEPSHPKMEQNIEEPISPSISGQTMLICRPGSLSVCFGAISTVAKALLHGVAFAKSPQSVDANRYVGDQCRFGLRLCLALTFFEMLPGSL